MWKLLDLTILTITAASFFLVAGVVIPSFNLGVVSGPVLVFTLLMLGALICYAVMGD